MRSVERRNFLKVAVALPFAPPLRSLAEVASPLGKPVFVAASADATGTEHRGPRAGTHLDFKVLTKDTQAGFFLIEHRNIPQGGPVRHLHYAQEEWFYLIEGNKVVIEVGDERFTLPPKQCNDCNDSPEDFEAGLLTEKEFGLFLLPCL